MSEPRILLHDIETAPLLSHVWSRWEANSLSVEHDWYLLSVSWKWLGEKTTHVKGLIDYERFSVNPEDDYDLAALMHKLFSEADIVVAHNGIAFDTKKAQARMLFHGFDPPTPFKEVDTLRIARKHFAFSSNKLGELCDVLGIGRKLETGGFETWLGCMRGDPKAWAKMKKYNRGDVVILEKLYLRLLPWTTTHPNLATIAERPSACPKCGSEEGMSARGYVHTTVSKRRRWQCKSCGGFCSSRPLGRVPSLYV